MCRHENEKRLTKKKKEIRQKIVDDAILYSFQDFFIRKIFYLILRKLDDHLTRQKKREKSDILKIQIIRRLKKEKNQKITKTKRKKFVKKSDHHQLSSIFENENRFHFFFIRKKNR